MTPQDALQYLAQLAGDFARTLPPSVQGPTVQAANIALATLTPLVEQPQRAEPAPDADPE